MRRSPTATKVLDAELAAILGAERFLSEIRVTANLQHPNLLALFDSGSAQGHPDASGASGVRDLELAAARKRNTRAVEGAVS